ncbi:LacI family DNA-binding transcriptional regulator [Paenibacillus sp. 481]|uniref:LacI family DNA-binding transcriptional regulator n=1 Tax=Paenibacillus sp. 481 TaxID=2835869 RepID=UPI001E317298|nr:LacI family DNA-binding transcriptional regulator [Paenibacillus sp. 481]UHA74973.1 LacI family DNA-binding transcriptional regulator [Paenibacillus sp. 481]
MKKPTMKEIARRANVSVATVSYVLNNAPNQTIPEKTRSLIHQIANELNFIPNLAARSLVKKRTGLVGILINKHAEQPVWKRYSQHLFVDELEQLLTAAGFHTLLISLDASNPKLDVIAERKLEAAFLIDVKEDIFYSISNKFVEGVPLILIDSLIDDTLFNQINYDYESAFQQAFRSLEPPYCLVMEHHHNQALVNKIKSASGLTDEHIFIVKNVPDLADYIRIAPFKSVVVINEMIGNYIERANLFEQLAVICTCSCPEILSATTHKVVFQEEKSAVAFELMKQLLHSAAQKPYKHNQFLIQAKV